MRFPTLSKKWINLLRFGYKAGLFVWLCNAFALIFQWLQEGKLFALQIDGRPYVTDFLNSYSAGRLALDAQRAAVNIYDAQAQDLIMRSLMYPLVPEVPFFNQTPPHCFVLAMIFPLMSVPVAWGAYCLTASALLFAFLYVLVKDELKSPKDFFVVALGVASCFPYWISIRLGNYSILIASFVVLFFHLLRINRRFAAGISTAAISMKFQYLPFLGLAGLAAGRLPFLTGSIVGHMIVVVLCGLILGWDNVLSYPHVLLHQEYSQNISGVEPQHQQNLRALILRLTGSDASTFCIITTFVAAALIFAVWLRAWKNISEPNRFKLLVSLTVICMLFFSPHTHRQDYLVLCVPGAWIWTACLRSETLSKRWPKKFVAALPPLSWLLYFIDGLLPLPGLCLPLPFLAAAAWITFAGDGPAENNPQSANAV